MNKVHGDAVSTSAPSRREKNLQDIRARGVALAERIIDEDGADALTARGLAEGIGCSIGALYNAFGHIDGVVRAVNLRTIELLDRELQQAAAPHGDDRKAALNAMAAAYFGFAHAHRRRWSALFEREMATPPDERYDAPIEDVFARVAASAAPSDDADAARVRLRLLWAAVHGLASLSSSGAIKGLSRDDARSYLRVLVSTAINAAPARDEKKTS